MSRKFCPHINDTCKEECMYNLGDASTGFDFCMLQEAVRTVWSLSAPGNCVNKKLDELKIILQNIESNTSSDQTESFSIKYAVESIKNLLETNGGI